MSLALNNKHIFFITERDGQTSSGEHRARVRGQLRQRECHLCFQENVAVGVAVDVDATTSRTSRRRSGSTS